MNLTIEWRGLTLIAEADCEPYREGRYSGPPENCYESTGGYCELVSVFCAGKDASFLLDSDEIKRELTELADDALDNECRRAEEEAAYEAYEEAA